jgi:type II secretory pathway pseudopilin PulG
LRTRKADGFALIDLIFTVGLIATLAMLALPRLVLARQSAGSASAIGSMRTISSAQLSFALTCGGGFYAPNLMSLGTPPPASSAGFVSPQLAVANQVTRAGYLIQMSATPFAPAPPTCNGLALGATGQAFKAAADPVEPGNPRYFAINANGQIFEHTSTLFAAMPEAGEPGIGHLLK